MCWVVQPSFEITHAPNTFMIRVDRDSLGRFFLIFGFNTNLGAHMGHLRLVVLFGGSNQHENTEKSMFYCITFLNFLKSDQGAPVDPKRIKDIPKWPTSPSIREIWGFHDLTNFYKRFVPYFSILVAPLETPWNIISYKLTFNCIYCDVWLYDRLEWVEVCLELFMCEFLDIDVELCGVLLS